MRHDNLMNPPQAMPMFGSKEEHYEEYQRAADMAAAWGRISKRSAGVAKQDAYRYSKAWESYAEDLLMSYYEDYDRDYQDRTSSV